MWHLAGRIVERQKTDKHTQWFSDRCNQMIFRVDPITYGNTFSADEASRFNIFLKKLFGIKFNFSL